MRNIVGVILFLFLSITVHSQNYWQQNADYKIEVDVNEGTMNLKVDDKIIENRLKNYSPILPEISGGYQKMYIEHVMQAD